MANWDSSVAHHPPTPPREDSRKNDLDFAASAAAAVVVPCRLDDESNDRRTREPGCVPSGHRGRALSLAWCTVSREAASRMRLCARMNDDYGCRERAKSREEGTVVALASSFVRTRTRRSPNREQVSFFARRSRRFDLALSKFLGAEFEASEKWRYFH